MPAATEGRSIVSKNAANRTGGYGDTFTYSLPPLILGWLERMAARGMPFRTSFRNEPQASPRHHHHHHLWDTSACAGDLAEWLSDSCAFSSRVRFDKIKNIVDDVNEDGYMDRCNAIEQNFQYDSVGI